MERHYVFGNISHVTERECPEKNNGCLKKNPSLIPLISNLLFSNYPHVYLYLGLALHRLSCTTCDLYESQTLLSSVCKFLRQPKTTSLTITIILFAFMTQVIFSFEGRHK